MPHSPSRPFAVGFAPAEISASINEPVVAQHAEDAAFLWTQRDEAVGAPHFTLSDLIRWDDRLEGCLEGLRIAGDHGWRLCEQALEDGGPGEVFAAAILALHGDGHVGAERLQRVLTAGAGAPELARGVAAALGWTAWPRAEQAARALLEDARPEVRRLALAAFAAHRQHPGDSLDAALDDGDPRVRARAARASGEIARPDLHPRLRRAFADPDAAVRFWAAWSAARLGDRSAGALDTLREAAGGDGPHTGPAREVLLRIERLPDARSRWESWAGDPARDKRVAAQAAGIIGDPALIAELLEWMADPDAARAAGEAFTLITGTDLALVGLDRDAPELRPESTEEDDDAPPDPDAHLPWPDPEKVRTWWAEHRGEFRDGVRHLRGREISEETANWTLLEGMQRQRAAAALELALLRPGEPIFNVRASGREQRLRLAGPHGAASWSS